MRKYCKAYHLQDMRQFPGWKEAPLEGETQLSDESIVYLWDNLTVVSSPIYPDKSLLWNTISPEWQRFCSDILHFEIPEDLRYAYAQTQDKSTAE